MPSAVLEYRPVPTPVRGVTLHRLPEVHDIRGMLSFCEIGRLVPFLVQRYFVVFGTADDARRGAHAHRSLHQFLSCVHGCCHVLVDDGETRQEFVLDSPTLGLHIPPMIWGTQYRYSAGAVLLVLASDAYDESDYIRDYGQFLQLARAR